MGHLRSMTGFGAGDAVVYGRRVTVEVRSVNHRFLDARVRLPEGWLALEPLVIAALRKHFHRGRVEVHIRILNVVEPDIAGRYVGIDIELARAVGNALHELAHELKLPGVVDLAILSRFKDLIVTKSITSESVEDLWQSLEPALLAAIGGCIRVSRREGEALGVEIRSHLSDASKILGQIETQAPRSLLLSRERLTERLRQLLATEEAVSGDTPGGRVVLDEARVLQEAALLAERSDIAEEIDRLHIHLDSFEELMEGAREGAPVGRRLDFLLQELNREANTIGSKSSDAKITALVIELKASIERMREQVQNLE